MKAPIPLVTCLLACLSAPLVAQTITWNGGSVANGNWSNGDNWAGGDAPGSADTALFNSAITNTWGSPGSPIVIDNVSGQPISGMIFNLAGVGNFVIGTTGGNALLLTSGGSIQMTNNVPNTSAQTINAPLVIVGEDGTYTFANNKNNASSSLTLGGAISGGTVGHASIQFSASNSSAPNVASGIISNGAATSLSLSHNSGTWTYSGSNTYSGTTTVNAGNANFTGANTGTGALTINGGTASFGTNAVATGSTAASSIFVNGGTLTLNNTAGNANRIGDATPITLSSGGHFNIIRNADINSTETIGALTFSTGRSMMTMNSAASRVTTLNASNLNRDDFGIGLIRGSNLNGSTSTNTTRIFLTTAPSGANLVGSGGSPSAVGTIKNLGIVPWLLGDTSTTGSGNSFLTYDSNNGLRILANNEYQSSIAAAAIPGVGGTGDNVRASGSEAGLTSKTINSLFLNPSGSAQTITGAGAGNVLTISSGAIAHTGNATAPVTLSGFDQIAFGNGEAVFSSTNSAGILTMDSPIAVGGAGNLSKGGLGTLVLNQNNTLAGQVNVQMGTLRLGSGGTTGDLGTSTRVVIDPSATLDYNRTNALTVNNVTGGGGVAVSQASGVLTLNQQESNLTLGAITGVVGSTAVLSGNGTTTMTGKPGSEGQLVRFQSGTYHLENSRQWESNLEITGGVVNSEGNQTSLRRSTVGTQTLTISGGELNVFSGFGLKGLNGDNFGNPLATTFIGTQTGGIFSITDAGSSGGFQMGADNAVAASTTYTLSGGLLSYIGGTTNGFVLGADTGGNATTTFNLAGGKLISSQTIVGRNGTGAKQAFVWTGGVLAASGYNATNLTSTAGLAVSGSTNTLTNAGGTLAPGDIGTVGRFGIAGHYEVTSANANLNIDIGGTTAATSFQEAPGSGRYDVVFVSQNDRSVTLGGSLSVNLVDGFDGVGSFTIINNIRTGGTVSGTFNNTAAANGGGVRVALANGLSSYRVNYNAQDVTLNNFSATNEWSAASGSNWTGADNWSAFVPSLAGHIARFADAPAAGAVAVNLNAIQTVRGLIFDSTTRNYTISTAASYFFLNGGGAASAITAVGNHQINAPVFLENEVVITTAGAADSLTVNGQINGSSGIGLSKEGSGTLILGGGNTYTGATTISNGTLLIASGSINNTSGVSVTGSSSTFRYNSGTAGLGRNVNVTAGGTFAYNSATSYSGTLTLTNGTLGGTNWNGNLGGLTVGANQTISPGNSVGHATTTTQTWSGGGSYLWEINNATGTAGETTGGWDLLSLSGALTLSSSEVDPFTILVSSLGLDNLPGLAVNFNSSLDYNWLIAEAGSTIAGFSSSLFAVDASGFSNPIDPLGIFSVVRGDSVLGGNDSQLYLSYTVIPEPSTGLLLGIALLTGIALVRRRRVC